MLPNYDPNGPSGLGGWLLLPLLGLVVSILSTGFNMLQAIGTWETVSIIISGSDPNFAHMQIPVLASLISGSIVLIVAPICLILMFMRSPQTPNWMIGFYLLGLVVAIIEYFAARAMMPVDPGITGSLIGGVIGALIWIPYFRRSQRVANTFRRPGVDETQKVFS